jgi:transcriptional regulator with XRE-family HTH domain
MADDFWPPSPDDLTPEALEASFRRNVHMLRALHDLTAAELAELAGYGSRQAVEARISGTTKPTLDDLARFAAALGVEPAVLLHPVRQQVMAWAVSHEYYVAPAIAPLPRVRPVLDTNLLVQAEPGTTQRPSPSTGQTEPGPGGEARQSGRGKSTATVTSAATGPQSSSSSSSSGSGSSSSSSEPTKRKRRRPVEPDGGAGVGGDTPMPSTSTSRVSRQARSSDAK